MQSIARLFFTFTTILLIGGAWFLWRHVQILWPYVWVSCPPSLVWQVDTKAMRDYVPQAPTTPTVVYLSCGFKVTPDGLGLGTLRGLLYAEQGEWRGLRLITFYPDLLQWASYDSAARAKLFSMLLVKELRAPGDDSWVHMYSVPDHPATVIPILGKSL